jgi:hypothetical protein
MRLKPVAVQGSGDTADKWYPGIHISLNYPGPKAESKFSTIVYSVTAAIDFTCKNPDSAVWAATRCLEAFHNSGNLGIGTSYEGHLRRLP